LHVLLELHQKVVLLLLDVEIDSQESRDLVLCDSAEVLGGQVFEEGI